ncbi:MAG: response regulator [bacterium]|nr:response regulator [bacterium]
MSNKTIFLVDDDPTFIETTKIALEGAYNIETAKSGKECLERVGAMKPDLIILDVMMRHLSEGVDTSKKLGEDAATKDIPVIMLTGVNEVYDLESEADKSQFRYDLWLEKPVEPDQLLKEAEKLVGK